MSHVVIDTRDVGRNHVGAQAPVKMQTTDIAGLTNFICGFSLVLVGLGSLGLIAIGAPPLFAGATALCGVMIVGMFWAVFLVLFAGRGPTTPAVDKGRSVFIFGLLGVYALAFAALIGGFFG